MARKQSIYRQLAVAKALASGTSEREIVREFAKKWRLRPDSVRKMLQKFVSNWTKDPIAKSSDAATRPWNTSPEARERMQVLREAMAKNQSRGDVVRRYAALWGVSADWVHMQIARMLVEEQDAIEEQVRAELQVYLAKIQAQIACYSRVRDFPSIAKAYERLSVLSEC